MNNSKSQMCFIDFETTGSNVFEHHAIEIGALLVDEQLNILDEFNSPIKPPNGSKNTEVAFKIHHMKLSDLQNAPKSKEILTKFFDCFGTNYCFIGWNISFDIPFFRKLCHINNMMEQYNKIDYRHIDVQTICRIARELQLIDQDVKSLKDCVNYFDLKRSKVHNALEDARLTFSVYKELIKLVRRYILVHEF